MNNRNNSSSQSPAVAAIGTFDGVHRGHRAVLALLSDHAREKNLVPLAVTFRNHPLEIIDVSRVPSTLTPLKKKKKLLEEAGAKPVVLEFDEKMRFTTAEEWMRRLRDEYSVDAIVMGYDNTFGSDGVNLSLEDYRGIGSRLGIDILIAEEIKNVSSSAIRKAVAEGDMEKARRMLGRPYSITANVVKGNNLGHTIGFPTANIEPPKGVALPRQGVYAAIVKTLSDGKKYPAMVNIGSRPTVMRGSDTVIEAHLLDFSGDLYGKEITVRFLNRLRDEQKFDSIDALRLQLSRDREAAIDYLSRQNQ